MSKVVIVQKTGTSLSKFDVKSDWVIKAIVEGYKKLGTYNAAHPNLETWELITSLPEKVDDKP